MTAPQGWPSKGLWHYTEAERFLRKAAQSQPGVAGKDLLAVQGNLLAAAQVHATLALYRTDTGGQQ